MLTWELVGAVVGAGLASGREVASFFTRHGRWSTLGILVAGITLISLAKTRIPAAWKRRWPEQLWRILLSLLLIATGGAMLSGAGEVAALTLPIHGAYWIGMAGTLVLAWRLADRTSVGLAWVSRILLCVLAVMIIMGFRQTAAPVIVIPGSSLMKSVAGGFAYGGFNAALQVSILAENEKHKGGQRKHILFSGLLIMTLLLLGNTVLLRQPTLISEAMPFVSLMRSCGKLGYYLGAMSLFLAILSTLTACLRGLARKLQAVIGVIAVAMLGFHGVVEKAYPLLGGACMLMLVVAKLTNYFSGPFISRQDMI